MSALGIGGSAHPHGLFQVGGVWGLLFCRRSLLPLCLLSPLIHGYHASAEKIQWREKPVYSGSFRCFCRKPPQAALTT